jgi:hypothetical protein
MIVCISSSDDEVGTKHIATSQNYELSEESELMEITPDLFQTIAPKLTKMYSNPIQDMDDMDEEFDDLQNYSSPNYNKSFEAFNLSLIHI